MILIFSTGFGQDNSSKFKSEVLAETNADKTDVKHQILTFDIASLLTKSSNTIVVGFIGTDFQRLRMKFISAIKNGDVQNQYFVYGKSMVKDNVCEFQGTLTLLSAYFLKKSETTEFRQGIIVGDYTLFENPSQKHVGQFKGSFKIAFYLDKDDKIQYDDLRSEADEFSNNEFVGIWTSYSGKLTKECNWGDYRIPMSGDLDIGTAEFIPDEKYVDNGWLNYTLANSGRQDKISEEARTKEEEEWWK
jgi:hypothetical protein